MRTYVHTDLYFNPLTYVGVLYINAQLAWFCTIYWYVPFVFSNMCHYVNGMVFLQTSFCPNPN